jgi:hypothetical protein
MTDNVKNFAKGTLTAGITNVATSATLTTGHGARFPAAFYATIWDSSTYGDPADAVNAGHGEVVRVARSTDALTLTRAQEGTSAVALNTGGKTYSIIQGFYAGDVLKRIYSPGRVLPTGNAIDTSEPAGYFIHSANATMTYSAAFSVQNQTCGYQHTNTSASPITITLPSAVKQIGASATQTTYVIPALATLFISLRYDLANTTTFISGVLPPSTVCLARVTFDPKAVCDGSTDILPLFKVGPDAPNGVVITSWGLSFDEDPTTEADIDLKRADAFIGLANSAVIDAMDTTAGVSSETVAANINSGAAIAVGKVVYASFGTAYTEANHKCILEIFGYPVL